MATTTTNFGWDIPQSTDLVKDGATAIAALGQDIDTAFVDLKGGTTGQVLAKASNTDLDYSWVTTDDANAIQNAIVNAKGDIIGASANDVPAITSVGANGSTLFADSTTSTGLRWQNTYEAGKNFVINGGMDIWQRGTTVSFGSFDPRFLADRWFCFVGTAGNTLSQETTTVPEGARYALKWNSTGAGGSFGVYQGIETANTIPLAGKTVTVQAQVTGTTGKTAALYLYSSTGVDTTPISVSTTVGNTGNVSLTSGTFSTLSLTVAVPSNVKTLKVGLISADSFANTEFVTFGNVQLELGNVATSFTRAGATIGGELALCQRYYWRQNSDATAVFAIYGNGIANSTTNCGVAIANPVQMRTTPTTIDAATLQVNDGATVTAVTAAAIIGARSTSKIVSLDATVASGLTVSRGYIFGANNSSSSYIGFGAEL